LECLPGDGSGTFELLSFGARENRQESGSSWLVRPRSLTQSTEVAASDRVALVDGHIDEPAIAAKVVETAVSRFKSIGVLVNSSGIYFSKPVTEYTADDFKSLVSTNLDGKHGSVSTHLETSTVN
jgi:NADP-dependent 3-hydroxy acid dehydrogenase YdfG